MQEKNRKQMNRIKGLIKDLKPKMTQEGFVRKYFAISKQSYHDRWENDTWTSGQIEMLNRSLFFEFKFDSIFARICPKCRDWQYQQIKPKIIKQCDC